MSIERVWTVIRGIYDSVQIVLWAILCALVAYFVIMVAPSLPEMHARLERERLLEIAAESHDYCAKWGMPIGTDLHAQCIVDLQQIRANVHLRLAGDLLF